MLDGHCCYDGSLQGAIFCICQLWIISHPKHLLSTHNEQICMFSAEGKTIKSLYLAGRLKAGSGLQSCQECPTERREWWLKSHCLLSSGQATLPVQGYFLLTKATDQQQPWGGPVFVLKAGSLHHGILKAHKTLLRTPSQCPLKQPVRVKALYSMRCLRENKNRKGQPVSSLPPFKSDKLIRLATVNLSEQRSLKVECWDEAFIQQKVVRKSHNKEYCQEGWAQSGDSTLRTLHPLTWS